MATFQSEYEDATNMLDTIVSTQLSSVLDWTNVPGSLLKVSSSAAGYAWGISSNSVYKCQLPCSGNWKPINDPAFNGLTFLDLVTDTTNVYILSSNGYLLTSIANGQTSFTPIKIPFSPTEIFSTHSFIWAQDSSFAKQRCPKPCTMPNWIASTDKSIKITSSSDTSLYGVDVSGNAVKSDETLQSGWSPISGLSGSQVKNVIGDIDQTAIYGVDSKSALFKNQDSKIIPQTTQGYVPMHMTIEPSSKQMWMTTETPGQLGNVFTKLENPDYSTVMNTITPLDKQRDEIVNDVAKQYNTQTEVMTMNKQIQDVVKFFKDMFKIDGTTAQKGKEQSTQLEQQIFETQKQLDYFNSVQPVLQSVIVLLLIVCLIYILGSVIGRLIHIISIVVLLGGLLYISNFSSGN